MNVRLQRCITIALALCVAAGSARQGSRRRDHPRAAKRTGRDSQRAPPRPHAGPARRDRRGGEENVRCRAAFGQLRQRLGHQRQRFPHHIDPQADRRPPTGDRKGPGARGEKEGLSDGEHPTKKGTSKEKGGDKSSGFVSQIAADLRQALPRLSRERSQRRPAARHVCRDGEGGQERTAVGDRRRRATACSWHV